MKKRKKTIIVHASSPTKVIKFIPRTNKSIFIAAGGTGSGLLFYLFYFSKSCEICPNWLGIPRGPSTPARVSYCVFFSTAAALPWVWRAGLGPPGPATCIQVALQSPARGTGEAFCQPSVWHFIVFRTTSLYISSRGPALLLWLHFTG